MKNHWMDFHGPGRDLARKQSTSHPDNVWPDLRKHMSDATKMKAKQRWTIGKPKLDNARQWKGIFFIEPNDEEFKLTMKAARRKLEVPMPAAMPCKIPIKSSGNPTAILGNARQNTLVLRPRKEGAGHKPIKMTSLQKGRIL